MMGGKLFPPEQILTMLAEQPGRIAALTQGMSHERLHTPPGEGERSVRDIVGHLLSCQDMWGGVILRLIAEDNPVITGMNPNTWIKQTDYLRQDFGPLWERYANKRAEFLSVLSAQPPEGWNRTGSLKAWGQVYPRYVHFEADALARHERTHLRQIARMAAS